MLKTRPPSILGEMQPSKAIVRLALPATLALLAKAVYNIVDTAYIGMLNSDIALTAVGVTVPLLCGDGLHAGVSARALLCLWREGGGALPSIGSLALKGSLLLTVAVEAVYILLSRPLILLFNSNPIIVDFGRWLLISQVVLYPAFGLCYMMTITYQSIGESGYGLFLSMIRQGLFYAPFILILPKLLGVTGIYLTQPVADALTILVCLFSIKSMKRIASARMGQETKL